MESLRTFLERVNTFIGSSTFGRIFRLEGCGHVRLAFLRSCFGYSYIVLGKRDQEFEVYDRDPCWSDNVLHHGVRHICECMYFPYDIGNLADTWRPLCCLIQVVTAYATMLTILSV